MLSMLARARRAAFVAVRPLSRRVPSLSARAVRISAVSATSAASLAAAAAVAARFDEDGEAAGEEGPAAAAAAAAASSPLDAELERRAGVRKRVPGERLAASSLEPAALARHAVDKYTLPVLGIMAANTGVFAAWRLGVPNHVMMRHFTMSVQNLLQYRAAAAPTLLTSAFSHHGPLHFVFNMVALSSIAPPLVKVLGPADFTTFYLGSCLSSSLLWTGVHYAQALTRRRNPIAMMQWLRTPALGASGGVVACFAVLSNLMPGAKMHIIFLPMVTFSARDAFAGLMAIDTVGALAQFKYRGAWGHSAHLGGGLAGMAYYAHLQKNHAVVRQVEAGRKQQAAWAEYRRNVMAQRRSGPGSPGSGY